MLILYADGVVIILDRISRPLLLVLVASLPFEFRFDLLGLSNLQWIFVATATVSFPGLLADWRLLARERFVIASGTLVLIFWASVLLAEDFVPNTINGAMRVTAGALLGLIAFRAHNRVRVLAVWCVSSGVAASWALAEYMEVVSSYLFRDEEFYLATAQRLSGTFEYPNTAAAFLAMSLPLMWLVPRRTHWRVAGTCLLFATLVLTYSRGAIAAVLVAYAAIWLLTGKPGGWKSPAAFGALAVIVFGLVTVRAPLLVTRLMSATSDNPLAAHYELEYTALSQRPDTFDRSEVTVTNDGQTLWPATGPSRVVLSYRWYDINLDDVLEDAAVETFLPSDVASGESVTLEARFQTPAEPGAYLLIWDLRAGREWFSRLRIRPVFAEVDISSEAQRVTENRDLSHWVPPDVADSIDASVSRADLWRAAGRMFLANPILGVGPDNFRLMYGVHLGYSRWDPNIRSNSLYLELLSTTGVFGLAAFLFVAGSIGWDRGAASIALGAFLLHGFVDVFIMTTPIYFAFWILAGLSIIPAAVSGQGESTSVS